MKGAMISALSDSEVLAKFKAWLVGVGGDVLEPTNEWEIVRFRANGETHVVYQNKIGRVSISNPRVADAWNAYAAGKPWRAADRNDKKIGYRRRPIIRSLLKRDGEDCFYCGKPLLEDISLEHLVSRTHKGPNHMSNLALGHAQCNTRAGHLSVVEKIALRETMRIEIAAEITNAVESEAA